MRQIFLCRVLLGHIKVPVCPYIVAMLGTVLSQVYPEGQVDTALLREPLKDYPEPGGPKTYDSVKVRLGSYCSVILKAGLYHK